MLDPRRIGLNAEIIGFQKRLHQDLDFTAIDQALQTDYNNQNSAINVRRERDQAKNEIRVMGGQTSGFESNELLLTQERQQRQINGYPLRHFDSDNPAVLLPKKYGGFPLYNRNQVEYPELVSVFTEPMSAPLQRDTELLGRLGAVALSNDIKEPYAPEGFINPMSAPMDKLIQNENVFRQRKHLQHMSDVQSRNNRYGAGGGRDSGIFINKDGHPTSNGSEIANDAMMAANTFRDAQTEYDQRALAIHNREKITSGGAGDLQFDDSRGIGMISSSSIPNPARLATTAPSNDVSFFRDIDESLINYINENLPNVSDRGRISITNDSFAFTPTNGSLSNLQTNLTSLQNKIRRVGGLIDMSPSNGLQPRSLVFDSPVSTVNKKLSILDEAAGTSNRHNQQLGYMTRVAAEMRRALPKQKRGKTSKKHHTALTPFKQTTARLLTGMQYTSPTDRRYLTPDARALDAALSI